MTKIRKPDFQNPPMNVNIFKCPDCGEWFHISFGHTCSKNISDNLKNKPIRYKKLSDTSISTKIPPLCDMLDTDLCKHYQTKNECHYKETHYVRCVINKFTGTALGDSLPRKEKEDDA